MATYVSFSPNAEVTGHSIESFMQVPEFQSVVIGRALARSGFPQRVIPTEWYSKQRWLDALRFIAESVGESTLFTVGKRIIDSALWPEDLKTLDAGLASIDVAYHLNHRIDGQLLFDPATGTMKEGIGHYWYHPDGKRRALMVCHNPYPSEFDRGIVAAVARKYKPAAEVVLDATKPSRKTGGESCTYIVTW